MDRSQAAKRIRLSRLVRPQKAHWRAVCHANGLGNKRNPEETSRLRPDSKLNRVCYRHGIRRRASPIQRCARSKEVAGVFFK